MPSNFEKQFVDWISGRAHVSDTTLIGVGDDACLLASSKLATVVTTDTLCDQVHFDLSQHSLERIGHKSLAVSISDVLAMGAKPIHAVLTFFLPKTLTLEEAKELFLGAERLAKSQGIEIAGGDTNRYDGPLIVGSTVLGQVRPERAWKIGSAQANDTILVTGEFGGSILGKHLDFVPRTDWVQIISKEFDIHSATDVTDSLSLDLGYLLEQSQLGAELVSESIPIAEAAHQRAAETGGCPLDHALTDGEDFELILCVSQQTATQMLQKHAGELTEIGRVVDQPGLILVTDGQKKRYEPGGYVH
jgi:thiamine-monophosphate kinase